MSKLFKNPLILVGFCLCGIIIEEFYALKFLLIINLARFTKREFSIKICLLS